MALTDLQFAILVFGSDHPYTCKCKICLGWWLMVGPEETETGWNVGPFTREEFEAAGGVWPDTEGGDDDSQTSEG